MEIGKVGVGAHVGPGPGCTARSASAGEGFRKRGGSHSKVQGPLRASFPHV